MAKNLEKELQEIQERNKRVEADKAWETSKTRRGIVALATYVVFAWFLWLIKSPNFWLNALIPAAAFIISTLTLPFLKNWWIKNFYKK